MRPHDPTKNPPVILPVEFSNVFLDRHLCARCTEVCSWRSNSQQVRAVFGNGYGATPAKQAINTLRPRRNRRHFADDTFNRIFLRENVRIAIEFSLKFVPKGPINNIPALVQIMAWRRPGDKPLSEPVMVSLLTHICVIRPQWVKETNIDPGYWQVYASPVPFSLTWINFDPSMDM